MRIQIQFWRIDSWDNEVAYMKVNGQEVWKMTWKQYPGSRNSICGDKNTDANFVEDIADIDIVVPHD